MEKRTPERGFARRSFLKSAVAPLGLPLSRSLGADVVPGDAPVLARTVFGWFPARFGNWDTSGIQWDAVTHLSFRSVVIAADGSLLLPAGHPPPAFVEEAHRHGVKLCVLVWVNSQTDSSSYLANSSRRAAESLLAYVGENRLDGVCWDDEHWKEENAPLVAQFLQTLGQTFKDANSEYHVSVAAPPVISPRDRYAVHWLDWQAIADSVDAIIPMLYTANPPSIGWSTNAQPLAGGGHTDEVVARDTVTLMADYCEVLGGRTDKLLVGIPSFPSPGYEFRCATAERLSPIIGRGSRKAFEELEAQARTYGRRWDSKQQSAWYVYQDGEQYVQGWYDDEHSWAARLDYVNQEQFGGVGIWVLDGSADSSAMWDMLRTAFGPPKARIEDAS
jgi:spore germination protein YaaH